MAARSDSEWQSEKREGRERERERERERGGGFALDDDRISRWPSSFFSSSLLLVGRGGSQRHVLPWDNLEDGERKLITHQLLSMFFLLLDELGRLALMALESS